MHRRHSDVKDSATIIVMASVCFNDSGAFKTPSQLQEKIKNEFLEIVGRQFVHSQFNDLCFKLLGQGTLLAGFSVHLNHFQLQILADWDIVGAQEVNI